MSKNNGGPAFPQPCTEGGFAANSPYEMAGGGLSIRDYFAAKAMLALIPLFSSGTLSIKDGTPATEAHVSEQAYAFADAMLAERGEAQS